MSRVETAEVLDYKEENFKTYKNMNRLIDRDGKLVNPTSIMYVFYYNFETLIVFIRNNPKFQDPFTFCFPPYIVVGFSSTH